jgi:adenine-specific DNA-methyltransferase
MQDKNNALDPLTDETPTDYADRLGVFYTSTVDSEHKKSLGQFFTPIEAAQFMASQITASKSHIRILDPGCGLGILTAALIEHLVESNPALSSIDLVVFETDIKILPLAERSFDYMREWLKGHKIDLTFFLCKNDFILHNSPILNNHSVSRELYDYIISNPPYFKLPKDDARTKASKSVIFGQVNIYTIFLFLASKLTERNGKLIFITPRSFCSGSYSRLFRELFFSKVDVSLIHLFKSRKETFRRDKVLQENLIMIATLKQPAPGQQELTANPSGLNHDIIVSTSTGISDLQLAHQKSYKWLDLINMNSHQKILHLPTNELDERIIKVFKTWTGSLHAYGLEISTGPVVDFRSLKMIRARKVKDTVPLIWLHNVVPMKINWPDSKAAKGKTKKQYIIHNKTSLSRLIPNGNYIIMRRFSTKDDDKRLTAAPYLQNFDYEMIGIENHLNYIYSTVGTISDILAIGLSCLLNSRLFDLYFRTFNGNINVSATELRDFPLPELKLILGLGEQVLQCQKIGKNYEIDKMVSEIFNLNLDLSLTYG